MYKKKKVSMSYVKIDLQFFSMNEDTYNNNTRFIFLCHNFGVDCGTIFFCMLCHRKQKILFEFLCILYFPAENILTLIFLKELQSSIICFILKMIWNYYHQKHVDNNKQIAAWLHISGRQACYFSHIPCIETFWG